MTSPASKPLELLAPARDFNTACEAILHGADAVYIGAPSHGARSKAVNSLDDIKRLVDFAAVYDVKVYVTVNTIIFDDEVADVENMIRELWRIGVDALIVQDLGLLELDLPPIPLHASTQCDTRTTEKALFLQKAGFSQIVVARELGLDELRAICEAVTVPVEAFVHGALCVSYSGNCYASMVACGRSANRGECAQMCRLPYDLVDGDGKILARQKHFLSLRDMNRIASLGDLADVGVTSFKIEGRMKDASYVKNVTAAYRKALDKLIEANPERWHRASRGVSHVDFKPDINRSFNRGFTDYFLKGRPSANSLATFDSPKALGTEIGTVIFCKGKTITAKLSQPVANGDGISYVTPRGETGGFRVNRTEGSRLILNEAVSLPQGTRLMRSFDKSFDDTLRRQTAIRQIPVAMTLRRIATDRLVLEGEIEGVGSTAVTIKCTLEQLRQPLDPDTRRRPLAKLGGTPFVMSSLEDQVGDYFIPASVLTALRRDLTEALTVTLRACKIPQLARRKSHPALPTDIALDHRANIANTYARKFYNSCGACDAKGSLETDGYDKGKPFTVMTTRYCLRREMGACMLEGGNGRVKGPLYLKGAGFTYRLDFDCRNCQMEVVKIP